MFKGHLRLSFGSVSSLFQRLARRCTLLTCTLSLLLSAPVSAKVFLPDNMVDLYYNSGIIGSSPYPNGTTVCQTGTTINTNAADGRNILIIGDSITEAASSALETTIPGITIIAQRSKQFAGTNPDNPTGLELLDSISISQDTVVFALGTNNTNLAQSSLDSVISKLSGHNIIFVTNYKLGDPSAYDHNNELFKAAAINNSNVAIADWATAVSADPSKYINGSDGYDVHPTTEGRTLFAETIRTAVTQFSGSSATDVVLETSGGDNASIILGALLGAGYNQTAAAAIIGNLQGESGVGLNPRLFEGGALAPENFVLWKDGASQHPGHGFGIAQWTYWSRQRDLQAMADSLGLPVTSLEAQIRYLLKELDNYGPSTLNAMNLEEVAFYIYKNYERPTSSFEVDSLSDLDPNTTPNAYKAFMKRLNYAQEILGLTPSSSFAFTTTCVTVGAGTWTGDFPQYFQTDSRWADHIFGSGSSASTIGAAGCGPTSFAMMATVLLGREILPTEVVDLIPDIYVPGAGSSHDITRRLAELYGLDYKFLSNGTTLSVQDAIDIINEYLRSGWMIHVSGAGSKPFSTSGHYIGIYGIDANGNWLVADSAYGNAAYPPNTVISAGMNRGNIRAITSSSYQRSFAEQQSSGGSNNATILFGKTIDEGGLTFEQARQLTMLYGRNTNDDTRKTVGSSQWDGVDSSCKGGSGSNCVTLANFFVKKFTSNSWSSGNGGAVAKNVAAASGLSVLSAPPSSIYSLISFRRNSSGDGHVAVVVGYHNGKYIVIHAGCGYGGKGGGDGTQSGGGAAFAREEDPNNFASWWGDSWAQIKPSYEFVALNVNVTAIENYINGS